MASSSAPGTSRAAVVRPRSTLSPVSVALGVARQTWWLLVLSALLLGVAGWWRLTSGDPVPWRLAVGFALVAGVGLTLAFAVHEGAHAVALRRCRGVSHVVVSATAWRYSLEPRGRATPTELATVAVAGPGVTALVGVGLWWWAPQAELHWWFWAHLLFLLPVFGDGRSLLVAARAALARD